MDTRRLVKKVAIVLGILAGSGLVLIAGFSIWYVVTFYPRKAEAFEVNSPHEPTRILVATQGSEFKEGLVAAVCDRLRGQPVFIKVIDVGGLAETECADWDKVLVVNTAMMNIMSGPVRRLVARGSGLQNVLLLVTSGGGDFKPADLNVDALSGASRKSDIARLADLILDWADGDATGRWSAADQVVALEYFIQVDVAEACQIISSERDRYRDRYPDLEYRLNRVGHDFLRRGLAADSLCTFHLNRDLFPESWHVYDSYAEALLATGDLDGAIASYSAALELNPAFEAGRRRLAELKTRS